MAARGDQGAVPKTLALLGVGTMNAAIARGIAKAMAEGAL